MKLVFEFANTITNWWSGSDKPQIVLEVGFAIELICSI